MQHQEIGLPVNFSQEDREYFKCLQWDYDDPKIKDHFFSVLYKEGYSTDFFLKPLKNIEPWIDFYKNYKRNLFLGEILQSIKQRKVKLRIKTTYYCCINELSDNFFHWFTEVIPKMIFVNSNSKSIIFYIPFPLKEYQLVSLDACSLRFIVAKSDVTIFRKLKVVENLYKFPGYYHPALILQTSQLIKNAFRPGKTENRKIYVTRKNASRRKIINEDEIIGILIKQGFEIFDFDLINFKQQVEIIRSTSILVSLHGAALTNMLFMNRGSTIIEFLPKKVINDKCYFILAGTMNHHYYYVSCDMNGSSHITSDFQVDTVEFEKVLTNAIASSFKSLPS